MVKISRFTRDLITLIAILVLMTVPGLICMESGIIGYPPVTTRFVTQVQVIDDNGSPVSGQAVYAAFCLQKPSGWFSSTHAMDNFSGEGVTDQLGFAEIKSANITLTKGDILWMGASTDLAVLDADLALQSYATGGWTRYNYSDIMYNEGMNISAYGRSLVVRNSDGRMIDPTWLVNRPWFDYGRDRFIDGFRYMDNRSWDYNA